ncbi:hypothetical protein [Caulobacter endophyticus]|uniref:hypothetical protein n=1 Tax=Caulobacter endophyticus TaxID=2172652 RepID=UPI0024101D1A|nr:hypothetical protein [Caulobacter endophyticus]MDG2530112.1 hypothetical protein [Caulobacter endophyticus]
MTGLSGIVDDLEGVALEVAQRQPPVVSSRVLAFLSKVAHVVDQAYRDVLALLIDVKYVGDDAFQTGEIRDFQRRAERILETSHYRDAEEICSRLRTLRDAHLSDLLGLVGQDAGGQWRALFDLIEDREGGIIRMIREELWRLSQALDHARGPADLESLREIASEAGAQVRRDLADLSAFTNRILGLSGQAGLMEMLRDGRPPSLVVKEISLMVDQRQQHTYTTGDNSVLIGAGATTGDVSLQQGAPIDLAALAAELDTLRAAMKAQATGAAEEDVAIGAVAAAQAAAKAGDESGALKALKSAGKWALGVAEKVAAPIATAALKPLLGLP